MKPRQTIVLALGAGWLILTLLGSCSEENLIHTGSSPQAVVRVAPGRQPVPGLKVVAMDPATNLPAAGPVVSDQDGTCVFSGLADGRYNLLVFGGSDYYVVSNQELLWAAGKSQASEPWLPGAPGKTPPAPPTAEILVGLRQSPGGLPRISGMVVDAQTGDPLTAAFVGTSPFIGGYGGSTTYKDDVTLTDGRFTVSEIIFAQDPVSGNLIQVEPLLVTCAGYRPLSWTHQMSHGDDNLDISGVSIPLQRIQPEDTGRLSGRLLLEGEPAASVPVGLGGFGADKSSVGQPGYVARTDEEGIFRFTDLPDGVYFINPGFQPGDGFAFVNQQGNVGRTVAAGQETQAGDLVVLREVPLVYPPNGWDYFGPEWISALSWSAVPGAARYAVFLDRGVVGETEDTEISIPEDWTLGLGAHFWYVLAYNEQDEIVGTTEVTGLFFIVEPNAR